MSCTLYYENDLTEPLIEVTNSMCVLESEYLLPDSNYKLKVEIDFDSSLEEPENVV